MGCSSLPEDALDPYISDPVEFMEQGYLAPQKHQSRERVSFPHAAKLPS